jgi:tetratricopeptide (TPR) repeat protein
LILANCFLSIGNKDQEALKILLDIEENNTSGKTKNLIGTIYWKLGDEDKAFDYLQQALDLEPRLADAKFNLGIISLITSYINGEKRR